MTGRMTPNKARKLTPEQALAWLRSVGQMPGPLSQIHMAVYLALQSMKKSG